MCIFLIHFEAALGWFIFLFRQFARSPVSVEHLVAYAPEEAPIPSLNENTVNLVSISNLCLSIMLQTRQRELNIKVPSVQISVMICARRSATLRRTRQPVERRFLLCCATNVLDNRAVNSFRHRGQGLRLIISTSPSRQFRVSHKPLGFN